MSCPTGIFPENGKDDNGMESRSVGLYSRSHLKRPTTILFEQSLLSQQALQLDPIWSFIYVRALVFAMASVGCLETYFEMIAIKSVTYGEAGNWLLVNNCIENVGAG